MALDPIWAHSRDITDRHADAECTVYAFGMPDEMPNADAPRVYWIELVVCAEFDTRLLFDGNEEGPEVRWATRWHYNAYVIDDAGEWVDEADDGEWVDVKPDLLRLWYALRRRQGLSTEHDEEAENSYRRAVGLLKNPGSVKAQLLRWR
jgi:hypothetical protein